MFDWIGDHKGVLWFVGLASMAVVIASFFLIPALVIRIRPDYFTHAARPASPWADQHPFVRHAIDVGKNLLGVVLMVAGIAMFLLPGQGLLTLLVGFFLIDFPGKYRFEKWLLGRSYVQRPINWIRKRRGKKPLQSVKVGKARGQAIRRAGFQGER